ncbi:MAG: hypothetical protein K5695_09490 [Oscillospiraceae bacterium]|nr:hypothetical protein [Oscillospiraceae bacterium]
MKQKIRMANNWSIACFFLSSASLLGIPFLNLGEDETLPLGAYVISVLFWSGLLLGILLQIVTAVMQKKSGGKKKKTHRERRMLIPIAVFMIVFVLLLCFLKSSLLCLVIDLALLLFSIEIYFYLKRRNYE